MRSPVRVHASSGTEWGKVFPDQAMTLAAIDRLVHHATIPEMNVESYRRRAALNRKRGPGRPPVHALSDRRGLCSHIDSTRDARPDLHRTGEIATARMPGAAYSIGTIYHAPARPTLFATRPKSHLQPEAAL
jgi:hypothetical protein